MTREEALKYAKFRLECHTKGDGEYTEHGKFLVAAIEALQESERKKGHWEEWEDSYGEVCYRCSVCKEDWVLIDGTPQENMWNFCPSCGADMRGEEE